MSDIPKVTIIKKFKMECPECKKNYEIIYNKNVFCVWCNLNNKGMIELVEVKEDKENAT